MKKFLEILSAVAIFAVAVVLPTELSHMFSPIAGGLALGAVVNFASIDAQCFQAPNPGGLRRMLILCSRFFAAPWPRMASEDGSDPGTLNADNEITLAPTYDVGSTVKWAELYFPDGTADVNSDGGGDPGYQSYKHMVEVALAGFSKEVRREVRKHLNAGSVFIVEMKDGQYAVVGSSDDPIFIKTSFKGGKKGNDKRGYTLKGEVDGMPFDLPVMPAAMVTALPIAPLAVTPPVEDEEGGA